MIRAHPVSREPELKLQLGSRLKDTILYFCEEVDVNVPEKFGEFATWQSHGFCHASVRALETGDIALGVSLLNKSILAFSDTVAQQEVTYLIDDERGRAEIALLHGELSGHTDRIIGVGFTDSEIISNDKELVKTQEAISMFQDYAPEFYDEFKTLVDHIILSGTSDGIHIRSASSFNLFGLITIWADPLHSSTYYLQQIVHETAHLRLFLTNMDDELVLNPPDQRFTAPFRDDSRPMLGIFHALFVLCRMVLALRKVESGNTDPSRSSDIRLKLSRSEQRFYDTAKETRDNGVLTTLGQSIFDDCCNSLAKSKVDPKVRNFAD